MGVVTSTTSISSWVCLRVGIPIRAQPVSALPRRVRRRKLSGCTDPRRDAVGGHELAMVDAMNGDDDRVDERR